MIKIATQIPNPKKYVLVPVVELRSSTETICLSKGPLNPFVNQMANAPVAVNMNVVTGFIISFDS